MKLFGFTIIKNSELDSLKQNILDVEIEVQSLTYQVQLVKKQVRDIYK